MAHIITKELLKAEFQDNQLAGKPYVVRDPVDVVNTALGASIVGADGMLLDDSTFGLISRLQSVHSGKLITLSGKLNSGFDYRFKDRGSVIEQAKKVQLAGGTLLDNYTDLFDAIRLDLTMRKEANRTIRDYIYNVIDMPDAPKDVRMNELFPYGFVFGEVNGEGEQIPMGANMGGQYGTIPLKIYATGFKWTLLASLFDKSYNLTRMNDGVAVGYAAKQDDLAMSPIINADYGVAGTAKHTAASTEGDNRQEKWLNTIMNAVQALGNRVDPVTKKKIDASNLVLLVSTHDMYAVDHVINGLASDRNRNYPGIRNIRQVVGYDGEVINLPKGTTTYGGVTDGTAFLIKKNRYLSIVKKRGLTAEIDKTPDVTTLSKEERAWYFVEGLTNADGISNFIQKITWPAW